MVRINKNKLMEVTVYRTSMYISLRDNSGPYGEGGAGGKWEGKEKCRGREKNWGMEHCSLGVGDMSPVRLSSFAH